MTEIIKAAVVQTGTILFDTPKTIEKFADLARDAAAKGAQLAVFPEAFIGGYPKGLDFGARLGTRSAEGREDFRRYHASAVDLNSPEAERIAKVARDNGIHIVVGIIERDGGTLYCSALTYGPDGRLLASIASSCPRPWSAWSGASAMVPQSA